MARFFIHIAAFLSLSLMLLSCTYSEPQEEVHFRAFLPNKDLIHLGEKDIPAPLSMHHIKPKPANPAELEELNDLLNTATRNASFNHNRIDVLNLTDEQLLDVFDPFSLGGNKNPDDSNTGAGCGGLTENEPISLAEFGAKTFNRMCFPAVIKIALHRAVAYYDKYHLIITEIIDNITNDSVTPGNTTTYTAPEVVADGTQGVSVQVFFDQCVNHRDLATSDSGARDMCQLQNDSTTYHRVNIYPLNPTTTAITTSTVIGKMEWLQHTNSSTSGKMSINKTLMTNAQNYSPPQMNFEFATDNSGEFQSFVMKYSPLDYNSPEMFLDANVIRVTRVGGRNGHWIVEGSILYRASWNQNPLRDDQAYTPPEAFGHAGGIRAYFVTVADDVFNGGNAIYKAILSDSIGDVNISAFPADQWDKELHPSAAYKKILSASYTAYHYLNQHGVWPQIYRYQEYPYQYLRGFNTVDHLIDSRGGAAFHSGGELLVVANNADIELWRLATDPWGGKSLEKIGSCQPFGTTAVLGKPDYHPTNSDIVVVGDAHYSPASLVNEARVINVSTIATGTCATVSSITIDPEITTFTNYRSIYRATFSPNGSRVLLQTNTTLGAHLWNPTAGTIEHVWDFPGDSQPKYSVEFNPAGSQIAVSSYFENRAYVLDVTTGFILTIQNDSGTTGGGVHGPRHAEFNPRFPNQLILATLGRVSFSQPYIPPTLFRWDVNAWIPSSGSTTWTVTSATPAQLLQQFDVIAYEANGAVSPNTLVHFADIDDNGEFVYLSNATVLTNYAIDTNTGAIIETPLYTNRGLATSATSYVYQMQLIPNTTTPIAFFTNRNYLGIWRFKNFNSYWDPAFWALRKDNTGNLTQTANYADLAPNTDHVLTSSSNGKLYIWSMFEGVVLKEFVGHTDAAVSANFNSDGTRIVSSSLDGTARVWDSDMTSPTYGNTLFTLTGHTGTVMHAEINDKVNPPIVATAGADGDVRIYNANTGAPIITLAGIHTGLSVNHLVFSNDGTKLVTAGNDTDFQVYDVVPGSPTQYTARAIFNAHSGVVRSVEFFYGDDARILTTASDGTSRVFNISDLGAIVQEALLSHGGAVATVSKHGHGLVTNGGQGYGAYATHWDLRVGSPTYGQQFSLTVDPIGLPTYQFAVYNGGPQDRPLITHTIFSQDGSRVFQVGNPGKYEPHWSDFETYFNQVDGNGFLIRPNETVDVNPIYMSYVNTTSACLEWTPGVGCTRQCSELVSGCETYLSESTYQLLKKGITGVPPGFNALKNILDSHIAANPDSAGYYLADYAYIPLF